MDLVLQKATELGVAGFVPVASERSEVRLHGERVDKRVAHWRNVVIAACEQSGRARVPPVATPVALPQALEALEPASMRLLLDPVATLVAGDLDFTPGMASSWPSDRRGDGRPGTAPRWREPDSRACAGAARPAHGNGGNRGNRRAAGATRRFC
jgi:hypothetical protein